MPVESQVSWDDATSPQRLAELLGEGRDGEARELVASFIADVDGFARRVEKGVAIEVLRTLRRHTFFDELVEAAECVRRHGQDEPEVRRQLAQGLIEKGDVTAAIEELTALRVELEERIGELADTRDIAEARQRQRQRTELNEVVGLLGRAYKQLYVDARPTRAEPRSYDLDRALECYFEAYRERPDENYWHGVNYIALLTRRERVTSGDPRRTSQEAMESARQVLGFLEEQEREGPLGFWELASRTEALLALGKNKQAVDVCRAYLDHESVTPFAVQSTLRQFRQVWGLTEDRPPGSHILPMITARLAEIGNAGFDRRVGQVELDPSLEQRRRLERVLGDTRYQPIEWLKTALDRARTVARLGRTAYDGDGTGFLLDGSEIGPGLAGAKLLLTNHHVCTSDDVVRSPYYNPMTPEEAVVVFFGAAGDGSEPLRTRVVEELFTSPFDQLDATLLRLEEVPDDVEPPPVAGGMVAADGRVNIIGHPGGRVLTVSLQDNKVVEIRDPQLLYRTPTEGGSSGSPVFDQSWELVGLHHAAAGGVAANEGIRIDRILEALRQKLAS